MESFQVDVIQKTLRELQIERQENDRVLAQEVTRRRHLETKLESATSKVATVTQKHTKTNETVSIMEQKLGLVETECNHTELVVQQKRRNIEDLKLRIIDEERKQSTNLADFEAKMTELADNFREARQFYSESSLSDELELISQTIAELSSQVEDKYSGVEELSAQVKACQFEREKREKEDRNDISYSTVTAVCDMFHEENTVCHDALNVAKQQLKELMEQHERLQQQLGEIPLREE